MANYNPYENMLDVLDRAAEVLGYKKKTMLCTVPGTGAYGQHSYPHG